jgi:hypothetical protein
MRIQKREATSVNLWPPVICFLAVVALIFPSLASAQDTPRVQIFGGYSRLQFDSKGLGFSDNTGLNGGTASASFNLTPEFGVVGEIGIQTGPNLRVRDWLIGPQVMYGKWGALFFGHVLFGKADTRVSTTVVEKETGRAIAYGGGVDFPISSRFSIRGQADYFTTRAFDIDQKNLKLSTGIVFRWGSLTKRRRKL